MRSRLERIATTPGSSFRFLHRRVEHLNYNLHHHHLYELICHPDGSGAVFLGERIVSYNGPCVFLIGPDLPHTYHWDPAPGRDQHECLVLQFAPEILAQVQGFAEGAALTHVIRLAGSGTAVLGKPAQEIWTLLAQFAAAAPLRQLSLVIDTLAALAGGAPRPISTPPRPRTATPVARVQQWICDHLDEPITLAALGQVAGMHPRSLARRFRHATGHSLIGYVHLLRIGRACELLAAEHARVTTCCFAAGFGNLSHFNRVFRKITGYTPTAYQRMLKGEHVD